MNLTDTNDIHLASSAAQLLAEAQSEVLQGLAKICQSYASECAALRETIDELARPQTSLPKAQDPLCCLRAAQGWCDRHRVSLDRLRAKRCDDGYNVILRHKLRRYLSAIGYGTTVIGKVTNREHSTVAYSINLPEQALIYTNLKSELNEE